MQFHPPSQPGWGPPEQSGQYQPPQQQTGYPQWQEQPQQQLYYPPQQPQKPPKKKVGLMLGIGCGAVVALIILIAIIAAVVGNQGNGSTSTTPSGAQSPQATTQATSQPTFAPTQTASKPTPVVTQKPAPTFITFGDGSYQVGTDVKPGTYRTQTGSTNCYYERLKGFSGNTSDILANNNTDNPAIVTILSTDKGFTSQNCGTWTSDLSQITTSKTSFSDGMYLVGVDIAPGTYKNTASQNCYYARLTGFSNSTDDIIANNNTDAAAIITIFASDKGFESTNCGTWTKI